MTIADERQDDTPPAPPAADERMTGAQWVRMGILGGLLVLLTATTGIWGLVIVLGIVLMIFLHELGHFVAAKRAGMQVTEFFIGFGPRIWSFRRGETEYGFKVVPAGAYVKIIGMHALEEVEPADEGRTYRQGRFRDRFCVVVAGVAMNFLAAIVLIWGLLALSGVPGGSITAEIDHGRWEIGKIFPGTGAEAAGLRAGDKITAVEGDPVVEFIDLRPLIRPRRGDTVDVTYLRNGVSRTVPVALRPYPGEDGATECCLGVQEELLDRDMERVNPIAAVPQSFAEFGTFTVKSLQGLGRFFTPTGLSNFGRQVVNANDGEAAPSDDASTTASTGRPGTRSGEQVEGEDRLLSLIGVFQVGTSAADTGVRALLLLFVLLNISLGIINLVPLLPFDGGHIAIAMYEKAQERRRQMRGRYFADVARLLPLTYVVVFVLAGVFVTTTYLDLADPLSVP